MVISSLSNYRPETDGIIASSGCSLRLISTVTPEKQKLIGQLIATEFLFGESTNFLLPGTETESSAEFVKAFNYCQSLGDSDQEMGYLSLLLPNKRYNRSCKIVHSMSP